MDQQQPMPSAPARSWKRPRPAHSGSRTTATVARS